MGIHANPPPRGEGDHPLRLAGKPAAQGKLPKGQDGGGAFPLQPNCASPSTTFGGPPPLSGEDF